MRLNLYKKLFTFLVIVLLSGIIVNIQAQGLKIEYKQPFGISKLSYNGKAFLDIDAKIGRVLTLEAFKITRSGKDVVEWSHPTQQYYNAATNECVDELEWGTVVCKYRQVNDTLYLDIRMTNKTKSDIFRGLSYCPIALEFDEKPSNISQEIPYYRNNIDAPTILYADTKRTRLVVDVSDVSKKLYVGLRGESYSNKLYNVWCGTIGYNGMQNFNPKSGLALGPGQTYSYTVALRFCKPNLPLTVAAKASVANYQKVNPVTMSWKDKRAIGVLHLSSYGTSKTNNNPRNWYVSSATDYNVNTKEGRQQFKAELLEYADRSISILHEMNAQGMITWDIEGQEFPHPLSYIGSPEILQTIAPEMEPIADEYFAKFRKSGFKTGICIRPDSVVFEKGRRWIVHQVVKDPAATLIRKIAYARKRWGCTLFYIDSNVDPSTLPMDASVFQVVQQKFPDVLLIPEHETSAYYRFTAPFGQMNMGDKLVSDEVKLLYPNAFMIISAPEGFDAGSKNAEEFLKPSIRQGNILLFRAWYKDEPTNSVIKKAYENAAK